MSFANWTDLRDFVAPLFRRPPAVQMAALCHRDGKHGVEVLLVQSSSGRWILPKGWPMEGKNGAETALTEAWEEAGVAKGKPEGDAMGSFHTVKQLDEGMSVRCETFIYPITVRKMTKDYPEAGQRNRCWVSPETAADMVDDEGLSDILRKFADRDAA